MSDLATVCVPANFRRIAEEMFPGSSLGSVIRIAFADFIKRTQIQRSAGLVLPITNDAAGISKEM